MIKTDILSSDQLNDITRLYNECKDYDRLTTSLILPLPNKASDDELFLLCYDNNKLVSFLSVFSADKSFVEVYGLTSPAYRKKGLFTKLLYSLRTDDAFIAGRDILYLSDGKSTDCQSAYNCLGFNLAYSEYFMSVKAPFPISKNTSVKIEQTGNYKLISQLYCSIFDIEELFADELLSDARCSTDTTSYLFKKADKTIGMMLLTTRNDNSVYLWNFGLLPEYRSNKLSHEMLAALFNFARDKFPLINLQVSSSNLPAFRLYKKSGFEITSQISYYTNRYSNIL